MTSTPWTLDVLITEVSQTLTQQRLAQRSKRVQEAPDARTVRYYASLTLIDPPLGVRNRRKLYGERHRQQLVAIKRLQAEGLGLQDIRSHLHACGPGELAALARARHLAPAPGNDSKKDDETNRAPAPAPMSVAEPPSSSVEFVPGFVRQDVDDAIARQAPREEYVGWDVSPSQGASAHVPDGDGSLPTRSSARAPMSAATLQHDATPTTLLTGMQMGSVQLTFPSAAPLSETDRQRLRSAAEPLLAAVAALQSHPT